MTSSCKGMAACIAQQKMLFDADSVKMHFQQFFTFILKISLTARDWKTKIHLTNVETTHSKRLL